MSIEGRKFIIHIYEEIYNLCGLNITFDAESNIEKIVDQSGAVIYQNTGAQSQPQIHIDALIITSTFILVLITLCFIIARKNQLFIKGGRYDGFDEKEYA